MFYSFRRRKPKAADFVFIAGFYGLRAFPFQLQFENFRAAFFIVKNKIMDLITLLPKSLRFSHLNDFVIFVIEYQAWILLF